MARRNIGRRVDSLVEAHKNHRSLFATGRGPDQQLLNIHKFFPNHLPGRVKIPTQYLGILPDIGCMVGSGVKPATLVTAVHRGGREGGVNGAPFFLCFSRPKKGLPEVLNSLVLSHSDPPAPDRAIPALDL